MITKGDFKMETWEGLVNPNVSYTVASSVTLTDGMSPGKLFSVLLKKLARTIHNLFSYLICALCTIVQLSIK